MKSMKRYFIVALMLLFVVSLTMIITVSRQAKPAESDKESVPIVEYNVSMPSIGSNRWIKSNHYDSGNKIIEPPEGNNRVTDFSYWFLDVPSIPASQSDAVIIGQVTNASAFLSNGKKEVYSEFGINIERVLKNDDRAPIGPAGQIITEREGGAIRFPSGRVVQYRTYGQKMPQIGRSYLLFLKRHGMSSGLSILTGYELKENQIYPLDSVDLYTVYKGQNVHRFLDTLQKEINKPPRPTATATKASSAECGGGECGFTCCVCTSDEDCPEELGYCGFLGCCESYSPLLVDVDGDGYDMTNAADGVDLSVTGTSGLRRVTWTTADSDDSWLFLDGNGNGRVDGGWELFSSLSPQEGSSARNGFVALAEFDKPAKGGNQDGQIDGRDSVYSSLRLWRDSNHNGRSEKGELEPLISRGIAMIDLDYKYTLRADRHKNRFKHQTKVRDVDGKDLGRSAVEFSLRRL